MRNKLTFLLLVITHLLNAQKFSKNITVNNTIIMDPDSFMKYKVENWSEDDTCQYSRATLDETFIVDKAAHKFLIKKINKGDSIILNNFNNLTRQVIKSTENGSEYIRILYTNIDSSDKALYMNTLSKAYWNVHTSLVQGCHFFVVYDVRKHKIKHTFRMLY